MAVVPTLILTLLFVPVTLMQPSLAMLVLKKSPPLPAAPNSKLFEVASI
jgi:hypothetical protein